MILVLGAPISPQADGDSEARNASGGAVEKRKDSCLIVRCQGY
jgi:hypothetical protein